MGSRTHYYTHHPAPAPPAVLALSPITSSPVYNPSFLSPSMIPLKSMYDITPPNARGPRRPKYAHRHRKSANRLNLSISVPPLSPYVQPAPREIREPTDPYCIIGHEKPMPLDLPLRGPMSFQNMYGTPNWAEPYYPKTPESLRWMLGDDVRRQRSQVKDLWIWVGSGTAFGCFLMFVLLDGRL